MSTIPRRREPTGRTFRAARRCKAIRRLEDGRLSDACRHPLPRTRRAAQQPRRTGAARRDGRKARRPFPGAARSARSPPRAASTSARCRIRSASSRPRPTFPAPARRSPMRSRARRASSTSAPSRAPARAGCCSSCPARPRRWPRRPACPIRRARLTTDAGYNATLGAAFLGEQLGRFDGSYVLTFAGYNAGPRRAQEWIKRYGDPRGKDIDTVVDWIERIPFTETRGYVQRVMENYQVYKMRLSGKLRHRRRPGERALGAAGATSFSDFFYPSADGLQLHGRIYGQAIEGVMPVICLAGLTRNARDFHELAIHLSSGGEEPAQGRRLRLSRPRAVGLRSRMAQTTMSASRQATSLPGWPRSASSTAISSAPRAAG